MITHCNVRLEKTCDACPEQYDAFVGDKMVGYLRLRHGIFRVQYPSVGGELIFLASARGDGMFDDDEREAHLTAARVALANRLNQEEARNVDG